MFGAPAFGRPTFAMDLLPAPRLFQVNTDLGGLKFHGINIVPRPTDTGNFGAVSPANQYDLVYDFCTQGSTGVAWLQWIKPQIDAAKSLGANYVRWFWDATVLGGDSTHHGTATWRGTVTLTQFNTALDTLITYLASQGMWFYATAMEAAQADTAGALGSETVPPHPIGGLRLTSAAILSYVDAYVSKVSTYRNVIGIDVLMEFTRSDWSLEGSNLASVMTQAKTSRGSATVPLTCSIWGTDGTFSSYPTILAQAVAAGVEYFDFHIYSLSPGPVIDPYVINGYNLPCMIGETGLTWNGSYFASGPAQSTTHPYSTELRTRHYQDVVASYESRWDLQVMTVYGVTDEWLTDDGQRWGLFWEYQDANFAFTTPKTDITPAFQTGPLTVQPYNQTRSLNLTGPDTTYGSWAASTSFMVGWAQADYSNTFTRLSNALHRANSSFNVGVVDYFDLPSINSSITVTFDASTAVPSGGQIDWTVSLRHQVADATKFYFCDLASNPLNPSVDGLLSVYRVATSITQLTTASAGTPFNLAHTYQLAFTATGVYPTVLTATITDVTTSTLLATATTSDSTAILQNVGLPGLPAQTGAVNYSAVSYVATGNVGPTLTTPAIASVTATSLALSWTAAAGGYPTYYYIPQYVALDSHYVPTAGWTSLSPQTGTSVTVSGLSSGTSYATRVVGFDHASTASLSQRTISPWASLNVATFAIAGIAGVSLPATAIKATTWNASGSASTNFIGTQVSSSFAMQGSSMATWQGVGITATTWHAAGTSAFNAIGQSGSPMFTIAGTSSVSWHGASTAAGTWQAAGVGAFNPIGVSVGAFDPAWARRVNAMIPPPVIVVN